jgi:hypothetical protein
VTRKRADVWFRLITLRAAAILGAVCVAMMAAAAPAAAGATLKLSPGLQRGPVHPSRLASRTVPAGHTIASAQLLPLGSAESGGGGPIDFWRVKLVGGDRVKFGVTYPTTNSYELELYAPGTTDASFPNAQPVDTAQTNSEVGTADLTLQAPYTGNFVFAVCENTSPCTFVDNGDGTNPMNPYTFTPTLAGGPTKSQGAGEVEASPTIAKAPALPLSQFEAGGGNAADFWRVKLVGGDRVKFAVTYPTTNSYELELYAPGTTDASFPNAQPVDTAQTNSEVGTADLTLQAPYTGNFVFAVCENTSPCTFVDNGDGTNPMNPYTFTPTFVGEKTTTSLTLSKTSIAVGSEKKLKLSVTVKPQTSGSPTGMVTIRVGKNTVCSLQLSSQGTGTCSPTSNTLLKPGGYRLVASYSGSAKFLPSHSKPKSLTVTKAG